MIQNIKVFSQSYFPFWSKYKFLKNEPILPLVFIPNFFFFFFFFVEERKSSEGLEQLSLQSAGQKSGLIECLSVVV